MPVLSPAWVVPMSPEESSIHRFPTARIVVFAREPVLGQVKTRLEPVLGEAGCLELYRSMLSRILATVRQSSLAPLALWVSSNASHELFLSYCNKRDIHLQKGQDLGQKMARAAQECLADDCVDSLLIIGADCPAMDANYLAAALEALQAGNQVVIGPARDGGYVLIGLNSPHEQLFRDIEWGTERVLEQTLAHINTAKLPCHLLESLWDVDSPEDLQNLEKLDPPLPLKEGLAV